MDPVIIRAHELNRGDIFKKTRTVYKVKTIDDTHIRYMYADYHSGEVFTFGRKSQERIELVERNNFESSIKQNKNGTKSKSASNGIT